MLEFANLIQFSAMSLGNHDFDDGLEGLLPFVKGF
jgi:2',3'-cyclic-nucleotide 2'-phosphodiesterase (5'-nucleotidase family)